jgi:hypothetical protein
MHLRGFFEEVLEPSLLKDKIRIYVLAKELDVDCKDLIALCHRLAFDIKNQLSSLEPVQREQVETIISKGGLNTAGIATARLQSLLQLKKNLQKPQRFLLNQPQ